MAEAFESFTSILLLIVTGLVLLFNMVGKKAEEFNISSPMVFLTAGTIFYLILKKAGLSVIGDGTSPAIIRLIAELTLVVILFHDASTVRWKELFVSLPLRLLFIGLPITLVVIFATTWALMPDLGVYGTLLVAAALTPTDAGLGAPTVLNPIVPVIIRHALNVESGVNDGLVTPIVLIAILGLEKPGTNPDIPMVLLVPIAIAIGISIVFSPLCAKLIDYSAEAGISTFAGRGMTLMMIPIATWGLSVLCGANPFIAAYLTGFGVGFFCKALKKDHSLSTLLEAVTDFLSSTAWFFAGQLLVFAFQSDFRWEWIVIAFLSLTVLRILPVYISLLGTGLDIQSMSFLGWFGPRGLATVIFALFVMEDVEGEERRTAIIGAMLTTVLFSVFAHGISAAPLAEAYSKWVDRHPLPHTTVSPEHEVEMEDEYRNLRARGAALHTSTRNRRLSSTLNNYRAYRDSGLLPGHNFPGDLLGGEISPSTPLTLANMDSFSPSEIDAAEREARGVIDSIESPSDSIKTTTVIDIPYTKRNALVMSKLRMSGSDVFGNDGETEMKMEELDRVERERNASTFQLGNVVEVQEEGKDEMDEMK